MTNSELFSILFILVIIYLFKNKCNIRDYFKPVSTFSNNGTNISKSMERINKPISDYVNNCCLVKKEFDEDSNEFIYRYKKYKKFNVNRIRNTSYQNLFIDNVNGWSNSFCKDSVNPIIGSCRDRNFVCKDFMRKEECDKFNMEWSDKTCHTPYLKPFKIKERKIN